MSRRVRWLSLAEIAGLMKLKHKRLDERRQYVRRFFERLEKRDGTQYLHRFGPGRGKLHVSLDAIEQIFPWDPATLAELRRNIGNVAGRLRRLEKRQGAHGSELNSQGKRIGNLEQWRKLTERYLADSAEIR